MSASNDEQRLSELKEFLSDRGFELRSTALPLIIPAGLPGAYAVDAEGQVVGFKFSGRAPEPAVLIRMILDFRHLQRLVFQAGSPTHVPPGIGLLNELKFLWIAGGVRSIPEDILRLEGPIVVDRRQEEPAWASLISDLHTLIAMAHKAERRTKSYEKGEPAPDLIDESLEFFSDDDRNTFVEKSFALTGIFLSNISLEDPPLEIAAKGRDAIFSYFRERETGSLQLNEVKVLLVGNGSCGKTSLVKRVFNEKFDPNESQTHGISIRSLKVGSKKTRRIKANFWDFGGQEIMHATHQFFLSKRSLYVLVLDGRKEEDAEYWLQHIQSFGGDSPVMVVLNKIDQHAAFDVNRRFLTNKYPVIAGYFRLSCATGASIGDFRRSLSDLLAKASILQTSWPRHWFNVKRRLEHLDSDYISVGEYSTICKEEGIVDPTSQETLVDFLHDLGVVLHFRDLQLLDTHVLDPRWVTEGVYRIINSSVLAEQKGVLRLSQLGGIFKSATESEFRYSPDKHRYIVELMLKFELCYRLDDTAILVPDLLDIQEPEVKFDYENALRFVFQYEYLPRSIMPRFIVRMHQDIRSNRCWRTGVELEDRSLKVKALVRTDEKAKRIYLFVDGDQKRDYLSAIRKVISDINGSFEKLPVTELVPLPDAPEVLVEYRDLIGHELGQRHDIYVGKLRKAYSVEALLNGIEERSVRQQQYGQTVINVEGDYIQQSPMEQAAYGAGTDRQREGGGLSYRPQIDKIPGWVPIAGLIFGAITLLFFMGLAVAATMGHQVPMGSRFIVLVVLAFGFALSASFIGGTAQARGQISIPGVKELRPVSFAVAGGIATFVIVLILGWLFYVKGS